MWRRCSLAADPRAVIEALPSGSRDGGWLDSWTAPDRAAAAAIAATLGDG